MAPTILVIDDDRITRRLIVKSLSKDFNLIEAQDGLSGVQMALQQSPDLVICDITMPDIDGYAVLEALRDNQTTAATAFIFLSGLADPADVRYGMNLGADDYLTKPFSINELRQAVEARLRKQAIQDAVLKKTVEEMRQNVAMSLPHELRTAVMVLEGYIYLMFEESNGVNSERNKILEGMSAYTARLHDLSEKFLWFSKVQMLKSERSGRCERVAEVIQYISNEAAAGYHRLNDLDLQAAPAVAALSDEHLGRIVQEVIDNAFKFSEAGTQVKVKGWCEDHDYFISITDHGRGMTDEQISKVGAFMQFEREFFEQKGTGLGLTIAKRLTEAVGGRFTIQSTYRQQTQVTVRLPLVTPIKQALTPSSEMLPTPFPR